MTLSRRQPETHDVESFIWKPEQPVSFKPGQYLRWTQTDDKADDRGNARFFSISASPTEEVIRFTTKFADKSSSFKQNLQLLSPGDKLDAFGPMGSFLLPEDPATPVILVAGGIGVTPFRSMLKFMVDNNIATPVTLLYAARSDQDIAFQAELENWATLHPNFKITYILSTASTRLKSEAGQLDGQRIVDLAQAAPNAIFYLSGPEPMIESLATQLQQLLPEERIKTDYFPGYTEH